MSLYFSQMALEKKQNRYLSSSKCCYPVFLYLLECIKCTASKNLCGGETVLFLLQDKSVFIFLICCFVFFFLFCSKESESGEVIFRHSQVGNFFFSHFSFVGSELSCY